MYVWSKIEYGILKDGFIRIGIFSEFLNKYLKKKMCKEGINANEKQFHEYKHITNVQLWKIHFLRIKLTL